MRGMSQSHPVERNESPDEPAAPSTLSRARGTLSLDVGIDLSPENVLEGECQEKRAGVGAPRGAYRWPPVSAAQERELASAYATLTKRQVPGSVLRILILARRTHGPDTIPLLGELHAAHGVDNLLLRLRRQAPRSDPHPDWAASTPTPSPDPQDHPQASLPGRDPGPRQTAPQAERHQPVSRPSNEPRGTTGAATTEPRKRGRSDADEREQARLRLPGRKPINAPWDEDDLADLAEVVPVPVNAGRAFDRASTDRREQGPSAPDADGLLPDGEFRDLRQSPTMRAMLG